MHSKAGWLTTFEAAGGHEQYDAHQMFWLVLVSICMMSVIIWKCADGAGRDKQDESADVYGSSCAAACGAACGG